MTMNYIKVMGLQIALSVGLMACNLSSSSAAINLPQNTTAPVASPTTAAAVLPIKTSDEVIAAVKAARLATAKATGPRAITVTSYEGDTILLRMESKFVPPDLLYQKSSAGGQVMAESYWSKTNMFTKSPGTGNKWVSTPGSLSKISSVIGDVSSGLADSITYSDGKVLGVEALNGDMSIIYSYATQLKGLPGSTTYKVWVSIATGMTYKEETNHNNERTVREIKLDPSITVTIPPEVLAAPSMSK
jgi:hypothetical protein